MSNVSRTIGSAATRATKREPSRTGIRPFPKVGYSLVKDQAFMFSISAHLPRSFRANFLKFLKRPFRGGRICQS